MHNLKLVVRSVPIEIERDRFPDALERSRLAGLKMLENTAKKQNEDRWK
jgi:hypothetical protein